MTEHTTPEAVPQPEVLDADRVVIEDREALSADQLRTKLADLRGAFQESCSYAQQLWTDVARARQYVWDNPPAAPDDDQAWSDWTDAYSELTSILAGPRGDFGMGLEDARRSARDRRDQLRGSVRDQGTLHR